MTAKTDYAENLVLLYLMTDETVDPAHGVVRGGCTPAIPARRDGERADPGGQRLCAPACHLRGDRRPGGQVEALAIGPCTGAAWNDGNPITHVSIKTAATGGRDALQGGAQRRRALSTSATASPSPPGRSPPPRAEHGPSTSTGCGSRPRPPATGSLTLGAAPRRVPQLCRGRRGGRRRGDVPDRGRRGLGDRQRHSDRHHADPFRARELER